MNNRVDDARAIFAAAVDAVQADRLLAGDVWTPGGRDVSTYGRLYLVGMGKAALAMAAVMEETLRDAIVEGMVVVPRGYADSLPDRFTYPRLVEVIEGGHPVPDHESVRAARRALELAGQCDEDDLLIVLISGGGSALCADYAGEITLDDAATAHRLLLASGADIRRINAVRKHVSRIGGGRLAAAAAPGDVVSLVISDVVGDDLSVIASGPTVGDPTTFEDARQVMDAAGIWSQMPLSVRQVIDDGLAGRSKETLKPDDERLRRVANWLVGSNAVALEAAREEAARRGYDTPILGAAVTGEAREVGRDLVAFAIESPDDRPKCVLAGGETTVTLRGTGRGGRNQEAALAAAVAMDGAEVDIVFLSGGTDGIDGPTDAAGAWATPATVGAGRRKGLDAQAHLANNDSYAFFRDVGGHLKTGPTHTNVMDLQIILVNRPRAPNV